MSYLLNLFYIGLLPAVLFEMIVVSKPTKFFLFRQRWKGKKYDYLGKTSKSYTVWAAGYLIWILVGLVSSQWLIFLAIILLSLLPIKKFVAGVWIDAFMSLTLLLFIGINKFHLHYSMHDLWYMLTSVAL